MSDLITGIKEIEKSKERYEKARLYYHCELEEFFASPKVKAVLSRAGLPYAINFAKTPVDVIANRLEISAVTVQNDAALTSILQEKVWSANRLGLRGPDIHQKTGMFGDGYLIVWPNQNDGVDFNWNSPERVRVIYDDENPNVPLFAIKLWRFGKLFRANLYYADRIEKWITKQETNSAPTEDHDWQQYASEDDPESWVVENPYGVLPVFHMRTAFQYGRPDHIDAYNVQDAINKLLMLLMFTSEFHGFKQLVALMKEGSQLEENSDAPSWKDDAELAEILAKTQILEEFKKLGASPDQIAKLFGVDDIKEFDASDPDNFIKPLSFLVRCMAQVTTTPLHYFDPSGDVPSGESLRAADAPVVNKARYRQNMYGNTYDEAMSFALLILTGKRVRVDVRWAPAATYDDQDAWTVAGLKIGAGVPQDQVLMEMGYEKEQVEAFAQARKFERALERVQAIGDALQKMALSVTAGIVTEQMADQLAQNLILLAAGEEADDAKKQKQITA